MHTPIPLSRSLYIQTTKVQYRVKWKGGVGRVESRKKLDKGNKDIESAAWYCLARDGRTRHCIELRTERSWLSSGEEKGSGRGGKEHREKIQLLVCVSSLCFGLAPASVAYVTIAVTTAVTVTVAITVAVAFIVEHSMNRNGM